MDMVINYKNSQVRTVEKNGQIWFVGSDIASVLGYRDAENALRYLPNDEKGTLLQCTPGGNQPLKIVSESGLYRLIFKSEKPEAEEFRRWVTHEVLPSIRKYGFYVDESIKISTKELAKMAYCVHGTALRKIAEVLPQFRLQVLNREVPKEGLMLNAVQAYIAFSRIVRESIHYYENEIPSEIYKIFIALSGYKK